MPYGVIAAASFHRWLWDAAQESRYICRLLAVNQFRGVGRETLARGRTAGHHVIIERGGRGGGIVIVPPVPEEKAEELPEPPMAVGPCQAGPNMTQDNSPCRNTKWYIEPDNHISGFEQLIDPPEVAAFGDPSRPYSDPMNVLPSYRDRARRAGAIVIGDLIEIEDGDVDASRDPTGERRFPGARSTNDVDPPCLGENLLAHTSLRSCGKRVAARAFAEADSYASRST